MIEMDSKNIHISEELLQDYSLEIISNAARARIDNHLQECDQCSAVLEGLKLAGEEVLHGEDFMADLKSRNLELIQQNKSAAANPNRLGSLLKVAAVILILVAASVAILLQRSPAAQDLVSQNLTQPYAAPPLERGENSLNENWQKGIEAYRSRNFESAVSFIQESYNQEANDEKEFYLGLSLLYQQNSEPEKAAVHFENLINTRYSEQALWYKILAYYLSGEVDSCKTSLEKIVSSKVHYKKKAAERLLKKLNP